MIVVTNRLPIAKGHESVFEDRFRKRVHLVAQSPGFVRHEVYRPRPMKLDRDSGQWVPDPDKATYYEVKTWWRDIDAFVAWTRSESFREAHRDRLPKEVFAGPNVLEIHEVFIGADEPPR